MKKIINLLCLLFFFSGCSLYRINSEETTFDYYPPKASKNDVVYMKQITQPNKVIGYVTINTEKSQKREYIVERLKQQAALMGGDAITNMTNDSENESSQPKRIKLFANAQIRTNYTAQVVVFENTKPASTP